MLLLFAVLAGAFPYVGNLLLFSCVLALVGEFGQLFEARACSSIEIAHRFVHTAYLVYGAIACVLDFPLSSSKHFSVRFGAFQVSIFYSCLYMTCVQRSTSNMTQKSPTPVPRLTATEVTLRPSREWGSKECMRYFMCGNTCDFTSTCALTILPSISCSILLTVFKF